jgi:hypothetical protein
MLSALADDVYAPAGHRSLRKLPHNVVKLAVYEH